MRILMLTQFYPPVIGGEERHARNLSLELAARGHDVTVATLWQEGFPEFEYDQGVRVFRIRGLVQRMSSLFKEKERRNSPPFPDPEALWALRRIIKRERPHIVHAHNWMVHSFTPLKAWSKAKLVVTLHDCGLVCAKQQFVNQGAMCSGPGLRKCLACASEHYGMAKGMPITLSLQAYGKLEQQAVDVFLPVSNAIADANQLAKRGVLYRVIPNFIPNDVGMESDESDPLLEQLPKGNYLLFVGSVGHDKGAAVLLQAYAEMEYQVPLILIGQPEAGFSAAIPPGVRLLQSWPHSAVMSAWRRCTIALMPSICYDACPTVTMEAMAMGRAVVASHVGGLPDIVIDGETGILIPPGDRRALRVAIQRLLDDPAQRERMGAIARQKIIKFQARSVVPRIEQVYREVLYSKETNTRMKSDLHGKPEDTLATPT